MENNYFKQLNDINVNDKTEEKNGLTYLSWAWAWGEVKKLFPDATYKIYENKDEWNYFTDGKTCWVKTGVTINGIEHIEELPVMDFRNKSISAENVTSFDVNKAIQRSLTKACARHGLGLYIYAGEDLPESENSGDKKPTPNIKKQDIDFDKVLQNSIKKEPVKEELKEDEIKQTTLKNAGDFIFPFGKNKGKSIKQIYEEDKKEDKEYGYLDWCLDADFVKQDIKDLIAQFLEDINTGYDTNLEEVEIESGDLPF
jgi:hypothetical protein